jgi:hypothetical protein
MMFCHVMETRRWTTFGQVAKGRGHRLMVEVDGCTEPINLTPPFVNSSPLRVFLLCDAVEAAFWSALGMLRAFGSD